MLRPVRKYSVHISFGFFLISLFVFAGVLISGLFLQQYLAYQTGQHTTYASVLGAAFASKASLATVSPTMGTSKVLTQDWRAFVFDEYFRVNASPMYGTGSIFVAACDHYGAPKDCTILPAMADAETDLCKYLNSAEYHNCWGFGGGGIYRTAFASWEQSIWHVTDVLVNQYGNQYIVDPSLMERVFCGDEPGCTDWGIRVKSLMWQVSEYARTLGFNRSLFDVR